MDPILLQKQIRDNAQDVQNYLLDLKQWEKEMKRKEEKLTNDSLGTKDSAPVRSKVQKSSKNQTRSVDKKQVDDKRKKNSSSDYAAWDKFDADKACELIDQAQEYKISLEYQRKEAMNLDVNRYRDEAYYEKEMGNKFVKQKKWKEALECYTRAIEKYSFDTVFFANRALCHLKLHNYTAAEADCSQSLNMDPEYVKSYQRRATARIELKHYQEARSDLLKALELEPNNSFIKGQLSKLEEDLAKTDQVPENSEKLIQEKSSEVLNSSLTTTQESGDKNLFELPKQNQRLVLPITKPPHLRSKKPLKRIEIKEITNDNTNGGISIHSVAETNEPVNGVSQVDNIETASINLSQQGKEPHTQCVLNEQQCVLKSRENTSEDESCDKIPLSPSSSVQFITAWNALRNKPERRFQYLKQIPGDKLPNIFHESMESNILSEIISTLEKKFLQHKVAVYPYLKGLSQIKRFGALTMFLSKNDKSGLAKLFDYCNENNECTADEAAYLREKYEL